jgi:small subunit ribosomal protein S17
MAKKNTEELEEQAEAQTETVEETATPADAVEAQADTGNEPAAEPAAEEKAADAPAEEAKPKKAASKPAKKAAAKSEAAAAGDAGKSTAAGQGKRAEKIGVVASDKMTRTVVVRVDRLVKHPIYRKYVRKRKKFMAHDDMGAKIGDKVRIVETRPLSARKRWRVVEIIHRAEL